MRAYPPCSISGGRRARTAVFLLLAYFWRRAGLLWQEGHPAFRVGKRNKADFAVDAMRAGRCQQPAPQPLMLRVFERKAHHRPRQSAPSMRLVHKHVTDPGERDFIGD